MVDSSAQDEMSKDILDLSSDSVELLNLLNETIKYTCTNEKIASLKKCTFLVQNLEEINITNAIVLLLEKVVDLATIPPFKNREYFTYDITDFVIYTEITECELEFLNSVFNNGKFRDKTLLLERVLLKLIILIGGNINKSLWSSNESESLCLNLLNKLLIVFDCLTVCELLHLKACLLSRGSEKDTLIETFLSVCKEQLSSANWQRNPFLSESFLWVISQITMPNLSNYLGQVMAISLNFLDDHQETNKIRGIRCLTHLISNTSREELTWYNHAEVIYSSLKHQMFCKDLIVLHHLFPCVFMILKVVDRDSSCLKHHHDVLEDLMRDTLIENLLVLRRIYISNLCVLIQQIGSSCIRHLIKLFKIVEQFLEIEDGEEELSRVSALQLLRSIILIAWPRISQHTQVILKAVLKLLVDINGEYYFNGKETPAQQQLNDLALECLNLLIKVSPDLKQFFLDPDLAKGLKHVAVLLERLEFYDALSLDAQS